jgi:hypothetical protein
MQKILREGKIKLFPDIDDNSNFVEKEYKMVVLDKSSVKEMMALQKVILDYLDDPETYQADDEDFMLNILNGNGRAIGVIVDNEIVGWHTLLFPEDTELNLGIDLKLPKEELGKVAHLETSVVHPKVRKNSLHTIMQEELAKLTDELRHYHLCVTVSPYNYPSIKGSILIGLKIHKLKKKYDGKWRYILYKNLRNPAELSKAGEDIIAKSTELDKQQELLNNNYVGYKLEKIRKDDIREFNVYYRKLK